jgi:hypothetical protein
MNDKKIQIRHKPKLFFRLFVVEIIYFTLSLIHFYQYQFYFILVKIPHL